MVNMIVPRVSIDLQSRVAEYISQCMDGRAGFPGTTRATRGAIGAKAREPVSCELDDVLVILRARIVHTQKSSDCDVQSRVAFLPFGGTSPK